LFAKIPLKSNHIIKEKYNSLCFTDGDFDALVGEIKKSMVRSKVFKMPQIKKGILLLSELRTLFVKDADFDDTLFAKLGHMDGLKKIVNSAFQNIMEDRSLAKFYQGSNLNIIK